WVRVGQEAGIVYREARLDRSQAYLEAEPLFAQGRIALLDHPPLIRELKCLEQRPRPGGRTQIDHPRGGHDDHANVVALAVALAAGDAPSDHSITFGAAVDAWRRARFGQVR